jgi:biopolymer transport protein ExbB/TolQ
VDEETFWEFVWPAFEGRIGHVVLLLLAVTALLGSRFVSELFIAHQASSRASRNFRQQIGRSLRGHNFQTLLSLTRTSISPAAVVIASGLTAFQQACSTGLDSVAIRAAGEAATRSAKAIHLRMQRGLNYLTAIVVTAPFIGVFGTCYHILTGFKGCGCSLESLRAALAYEYSRALVPTALSWLVAVLTTWSRRYLESKLGSVELEMESASLEVVNYCAVYLSNVDEL